MSNEYVYGDNAQTVRIKTLQALVSSGTNAYVPGDNADTVRIKILNALLNGGAGGTGIPEAPEDGQIYGRKDGDWTEIAASGLADTDSYIIAQPGDDLLAKYTEAKALTPKGLPLSAGNRARLLIMPGAYPLSSFLSVDANFVDILALGASEKQPSVLLQAPNVFPEIAISVPATVSDVRVSGISTGDLGFSIEGIAPVYEYGFYDFRVFTNCTGGPGSFGGGLNIDGGIASSTFTNCTGGAGSFGGTTEGEHGGTACGTFTNCTGGDFSFGGGLYYGGTASGTFTNCTGGRWSFGGGFNIPGLFDGAAARAWFCRGGLGSFPARTNGAKVKRCFEGDTEVHDV